MHASLYTHSADDSRVRPVLRIRSTIFWTFYSVFLEHNYVGCFLIMALEHITRCILVRLGGQF